MGSGRWGATVQPAMADGGTRVRAAAPAARRSSLRTSDPDMLGSGDPGCWCWRCRDHGRERGQRRVRGEQLLAGLEEVGGPDGRGQPVGVELRPDVGLDIGEHEGHALGGQLRVDLAERISPREVDVADGGRDASPNQRSGGWAVSTMPMISSVNRATLA